MSSLQAKHISNLISDVTVNLKDSQLRQVKKASRSDLSKHKTVDQALESVRKRTNEIAKRREADLDSRVLQVSFPFWDDELRGVPNPFIRSGLFGVNNSKERAFVSDMKVASLSNYQIKYTGQSLQQDDLSVWMSLINFARASPLCDKVRFSGYQIVKDLGWRMHSESYKRVQESIERLKVTGLTIQTKTQSDGYAGSLIREYAWADKDDKGETKWMVRFEPKVSMLFVDDSTTLLEWQMRKKIGTRATLAQFLHAFYTSHREPIPLPLKMLHEMSRSTAALSSFRRNIKISLQTLVDVGLLASFSTADDIVRVTKVSRVQLLRALAIEEK